MKVNENIPRDEALLSELWSRFKDGDGEAFDQIFALRYRELFNYATRFTKDKEFIRDCVQDLFLEMWSHREGLVDSPYVTVYLIKSLRNNLFRKLKLEKRLGESTNLDDELYFLSDGQSTETAWIDAELLHENEQTIRDAIAQLPKRQQEVIFLKYYKGLSNEEIASVMNVEKQTVANFLHRSLTSLKRNLVSIAELLFLPLINLLFLKF